VQRQPLAFIAMLITATIVSDTDIAATVAGIYVAAQFSCAEKSGRHLFLRSHFALGKMTSFLIKL